ncbi:MAG: VOC family protein [Methanomicrobiales archaeon]|nr:VOC family protein [Methanomicrobiales archaeon]
MWFDTQAEEAVKFYISVFKDAKIKGISHYGKAGSAASGMREGSAMTVVFEMNGQEFTALNGGPAFKFNEAVSFVVNCDSQKEVDYYWEKLSLGGDEKAQICGWLKDQYGVFWQVVPTALGKMLQDKDPEKTDRVMQALLPMKKLDIATLERAYKGS